MYWCLYDLRYEKFFQCKLCIIILTMNVLMLIYEVIYRILRSYGKFVLILYAYIKFNKR